MLCSLLLENSFYGFHPRVSFLNGIEQLTFRRPPSGFACGGFTIFLPSLPPHSVCLNEFKGLVPLVSSDLKVGETIPFKSDAPG